MLNNNQVQQILGEAAEHFDKNNSQLYKEKGENIEWTVEQFKLQLDTLINIALRRDN